MKPWKTRDGDVNKKTGKIYKAPKRASTKRKFTGNIPKVPSHSPGLLLPKRYKTEALARKAVPELVRTTAFGESMVFEAVRCVGLKPDKQPEHPKGRYNWRLRRSF